MRRAQRSINNGLNIDALPSVGLNTTVSPFRWPVHRDRNDPGRYDQEVLLAGTAGRAPGSEGSPGNGLEVMYASASFSEKTLGHGEPVRVREGQRVLCGCK